MPRVIEQGAGPVFLRPLGHNQTTGHTVAEFVHPFFSQFIIFNLCFARRRAGAAVSALQAKTGETSPVPPSSRASDLWIGNVRYGRLLAFERTAQSGCGVSSNTRASCARLTPARPCAPRSKKGELYTKVTKIS